MSAILRSFTFQEVFSLDNGGPVASMASEGTYVLATNATIPLPTTLTTSGLSIDIDKRKLSYDVEACFRARDEESDWLTIRSARITYIVDRPQ